MRGQQLSSTILGVTTRMHIMALMVACWGALMPAHVSAAWTDNLRLTLANYAYYKTTSLPGDFMCQSLGKAAECCNCWNSKGDHSSGQTQNYCNQPSKCLAKKVKHSGGFKYARLKKASEIDNLLKKWRTPSKMKGDFQAGVLFDSSTFMTFSTTVTNKGTGKAEAHVGAARRGKDYVFVGWVYGKASADLITPRKRTARGGKCKCLQISCPSTRPGYPCPKGKEVYRYNFQAGTKKRGFRTSEVIKINNGLLSYAFADAAREADKGRRMLRSSVSERPSDENAGESEFSSSSSGTSGDEDPDEGFEGSEYVPFTLDEGDGSRVDEAGGEPLILDMQEAHESSN